MLRTLITIILAVLILGVLGGFVAYFFKSPGGAANAPAVQKVDR